MTVAIALVQVSTSHATAPVITDPGDIVIGDLEDRSGTAPNVFVHPDAFDANTIVSDDTTADNLIKWSFTGDGSIEINGVAPLNPSLAGLGDDDPTSPRAISRLDLVNADGGGPIDLADGSAITFTFRNVDLSPDNTSVNGSPDGLLATDMVTLFASDCTTFSSRVITVFTIKGESDGLSGAGPELIYGPIDFTTTVDGWIGGNFPGFGGTVASGASGLCMTVPGPGLNDVIWISPEAYIELVDTAVYRSRSNVTTTATAVDTIPLWFFQFDNFYAAGDGNNYGGFNWFLDVDGGSAGIGRAQGRSMFDSWFGPNAGGTAQFSAGSFTPLADARNDLRIAYRIIDANPPLLSDADLGTICIADLAVYRLLRGNAQVSSTVFNPPIDSTTHFTLNDFSSPNTTHSIDNANDEADIGLGTVGNVRVTVGYFNAGLPNLNQQLYPVVWTADTTFRTRTNIRATATTADPIDAIFMAMDVTNSELGIQSYTTASGGAVMNGTSSPKLLTAEYDVFFHSHNATSSVTPDANRLRGFPFFFNTPGLFGDGTGSDDIEVESLEVDALVSN
jgi:hypothetical protein